MLFGIEKRQIGDSIQHVFVGQVLGTVFGNPVFVTNNWCQGGIEPTGANVTPELLAVHMLFGIENCQIGDSIQHVFGGQVLGTVFGNPVFVTDNFLRALMQRSFRIDVPQFFRQSYLL
jgi:hypothetical protein